MTTHRKNAPSSRRLHSYLPHRIDHLVKDFLHNRPRVSGHSSELHTGVSSAATPPPLFDAAMLVGAHAGGDSGQEATVEAIKEGERVTKLIVTCRCGEKIEILCAYAPGSR